MSDCATRLAEAKAALHQLMLGEQVSIVDHAGTKTHYTQADEKKLRAYILDLENECGETFADGTLRGRRGAIRFTG